MGYANLVYSHDTLNTTEPGYKMSTLWVPCAAVTDTLYAIEPVRVTSTSTT